MLARQRDLLELAYERPAGGRVAFLGLAIVQIVQLCIGIAPIVDGTATDWR